MGLIQIIIRELARRGKYETKGKKEL